ncbi:MAG: hypothetical protein NXI18_19045 [Alphaproteobacteria bacterium]|nr:hypothetical protein [Alphaproteobacteria bacterium]
MPTTDQRFGDRSVVPSMQRFGISIAIYVFAAFVALSFMPTYQGSPAPAPSGDLVLISAPIGADAATLKTDPAPFVLRSRELELHPEGLQRLAADDALRTFELILFDDARLTIAIASRNLAAPGSADTLGRLSGTVAGDSFSTAALSIASGKVDGLVSTGDRLFRIFPAGHGRHQVAELKRHAAYLR